MSGGELSASEHMQMLGDAAMKHEGAALVTLAREMAAARPDFAAADTSARDVELALSTDDGLAVERKLEQASRKMRAAWLRSVAAETSRVLRSPTEAESTALALRHDAYGYERDFEPEALEARCGAFFPRSPAHACRHLLFSSGQAALASLLWALGERAAGKLLVAHHGCYFETRELCTRACADADTAAARCVIAEPVGCDGAFSSCDVHQIATAMTGRDQVLVVDETLTAPHSVLPELLKMAPPSLAIISLVSGLKLLQQGLELANVGILSIYASEASKTEALDDALKRMRTLTGAGLRFVDALALEAPFFLDRAVTQDYAARVFAHNGRLACAVAAENRLFEAVEHPSRQGAGVAPYCAFRLQHRDLSKYQALLARIEHESVRRGLLFDRGGSFGFRGHRFELIEPETGDAPFLRVAMGYRGGHSYDGVIALMAELAAEGI